MIQKNNDFLKTNFISSEMYSVFSKLSENEYNKLIKSAKSEEERKFYLVVENYFLKIEAEKAIASERY